MVAGELTQVSEKENSCLYRHPNESYEVTLLAKEVPFELPEPALGVNFARDGMTTKADSHWLHFKVTVGCSP
ncbi:hypothetical protein HanXRQr2_Chr01g0042891 [Helianthus annuus]|uniref:PHD finger protein ALFIN-LIKE n=1 Tax=Helianthus annuus TaxID=4232 RepID=A0A9K3JZM7_HELAN|nr:hypothetical protein HanXRQr2_Chr01g0042891 [Helianthus annuus]